MKTVCMFFGMFISLVVYSQDKTPTLEVFYIDNSSQTQEDYLNDSLKAFLKSQLEVFKDRKKKFLLFTSDGANYQAITSYKGVDKALGLLNTSQSAFPDPDYDLKKLRQEILESYPDFKGNLKLNFFISETFFKSISDRAPALFVFFPKEIFTAYKNFKSGKNEVNIYYSKNALNVQKNQVEAALNFYNKDEFMNKHSVLVRGFNPQ